jgi:hypothetical protein
LKKIRDRKSSKTFKEKGKDYSQPSDMATMGCRVRLGKEWMLGRMMRF